MKLLDYYEQHLVVNTVAADVAPAMSDHTDKRIVSIKQSDTGGFACDLEVNGGLVKEAAMDVVRNQCPQMLLKYYEEHL